MGGMRINFIAVFVWWCDDFFFVAGWFDTGSLCRPNTRYALRGIQKFTVKYADMHSSLLTAMWFCGK